MHLRQVVCEQVLSVFVDTYPVYVANILFRELFTIAKNAKFKSRLQDFLPCTPTEIVVYILKYILDFRRSLLSYL